MSERVRPDPFIRPLPPRPVPARPSRGASLLEDARGEHPEGDPIGIANDGREVWETGTVEAMLRAGRRR